MLIKSFRKSYCNNTRNAIYSSASQGLQITNLKILFKHLYDNPSLHKNTSKVKKIWLLKVTVVTLPDQYGIPFCSSYTAQGSKVFNFLYNEKCYLRRRHQGKNFTEVVKWKRIELNIGMGFKIFIQIIMTPATTMNCSDKLAGTKRIVVLSIYSFKVGK